MAAILKLLLELILFCKFHSNTSRRGASLTQRWYKIYKIGLEKEMQTFVSVAGMLPVARVQGGRGDEGNLVQICLDSVEAKTRFSHAAHTAAILLNTAQQIFNSMWKIGKLNCAFHNLFFFSKRIIQSIDTDSNAIQETSINFSFSLFKKFLIMILSLDHVWTNRGVWRGWVKGDEGFNSSWLPPQGAASRNPQGVSSQKPRDRISRW